jgi:hypothetical protein
VSLNICTPRDDQLLYVVVQRWSCVAAVRVGPHAGDQAVPAPQGVRGDEQARPAVAWQEAADRGEQGAVGGFQPGSWELASEDGELVAQDQDLQVLGDVAAGEQGEGLDGAGQREVGESGQHARSSPSGVEDPAHDTRVGMGNGQLRGHELFLACSSTRVVATLTETVKL